MQVVSRVLKLALVLTLLTGCRQAPQTTTTEPTSAGVAAGEPYTIGAIFPLSAGAGRIGQMKQQGANLAVEHLNADGGVNGRPLKIVYVDSKNSTTDANLGFNKLVDVDRVPVIMSAMSQVSLSLVGPSERRNVVLFANCSYPQLAAKSPYVFRNLPSTQLGSGTMAQTAYKQLGLRRVVVLSLNDDYGAEAARVFHETIQSLGGEIVGSETFERDATDFRVLLTKLAANEPDGWWIPGYGAALGLLLKQKAELRATGDVMCDLGLVDDNVLNTAGSAADGAYVVAPVFSADAPEPEVQRFVKDFQDKSGETPSFDAAFQYDAVYLIADAIRRASSYDGPALRSALADTKGFVGVCGPTAFDAEGEADLKVEVRRMADARLMPLDVSEARGAVQPVADSTATDSHGAE